MAPGLPFHPLDPLTADELRSASKIVRAYKPDLLFNQIIFYSIIQNEPTKSEFRKWKADSKYLIPREASVIVALLNADKTRTIVETTVELAPKGQVKSWKIVPDVEPTYIGEELDAVAAYLLKHPKIIEVCAKFGLRMDQVVIDPWPLGRWPEHEGKRVFQCFMYGRLFEDDNYYAHPLPICPIVDCIAMEMIKLDYFPEKETKAGVPMATANYAAKYSTEWNGFRTDLKPFQITQPQGASFKIEGRRVTWANWSLTVGQNYREGLVLHDIVFDDRQSGTKRPILHRASINEMVVPYGDPRMPVPRKHAFDIGELGLGNLANPLEYGCDCVGHVEYLDFVFGNGAGDVTTIKNAICIHEEDQGILWKHTDFATKKVEVRRNRRLVISFTATLLNYEYCVYWYLWLDGAIQCEVKATGILSVIGASEDGVPKYGTLVAPGVNATFHQHLFCARLDLPGSNTVTEVDVVPVVGKENPYGNAFTTKETVLQSEKMSAGRLANLDTARTWKVLYEGDPPHKTTGKIPAYKLFPTNSQPLMANEDSMIAKRAGFAGKHLWVTKADPAEFWAAGTFINLTSKSDGVSKWVEKDRRIVKEDLVMWHQFGLTHCPKTEDWPIMPVEMTGFVYRPANFYTVTPTLDVPPQQTDHCGSKTCHGEAAKL
ncbi:primary-amine oxidase [Synchytrium microbalum]|uniref:Amine oxidase n=1 Tax=Synchytrium microbalum TaxID=1806994 RepID=A0A507C7H1_9FUNG|nr:primary-amine oxidase [Synchytrium microbalum]TPX37520.1 primary-amine oxidase [Synchytrium microbalum]